MYHNISEFMYQLNCNLLSMVDGISIPQKSLLLNTFSWDPGLFLPQNKKNNLKN